jgi:NADH-quinone oxidoreductase subunit E
VAETVHAPAAQNGIDLDYVRTLMAHFEPRDWQEAQELILSALQEINEHFGYVSVEAAEIVADEPRGKHFMLLCHGMSCYVMGSQRLVQELADQHGIGDGGTTAGGEVTVQVVNGCLGVCNQAPIVKLDDQFYGQLTTESFNALVQRVIADTPRER